MYTIYADGKILYTPHLSHEGCGVLSPKLTIELNKAGSLEFTIFPNNDLYNEVRKLSSIITVFQDGDELFRGRVLNDEKGFYNDKKMYCEGELAFLLDSIQRPYSTEVDIATKFKEYISNHNSRVEATKQFTVGDITITDTEKYLFENTNYSNSFDEILNNIVDPLGLYIKTRGSGDTRYIDLLEESGETNTQTIEFGSNLLDITEYISAEDVFTVLIPLGKSQQDSKGKDLGKLTIASVNDDKDYLENSSAISLFGRIERYEDWSDVDDASTLKELGEKFLGDNIELAVSLELKAVDLYLLNPDVERIKLGDWVRVLSIPHGLDKLFQCTKIVYDLEKPENDEYTFGVKFTSLTDQQVESEKNMKTTVSIVQTAANSANASASRANQAAVDAETVISTLPDTYVQTVAFEAYKLETNSSISDLNNNYADLLRRVTILEGGTV